MSTLREAPERREDAVEEIPEPVGRLARAYGWITTRLALLLIALVVAAVVAAYHFLPSISSAPTGTTENLLPKNPTALAVTRRSTRIFGAPVLTPYAVVQRNPAGLSARVQLETIRKAVRVDRKQGPNGLRPVFALPVINTLGLFPSSKEHGTTAITYLYMSGSISSGTGYDLTREYAAYLGSKADVIGPTGAVPARIEQFNVLQDRIHWTEAATVILIMLIVGIAFRSLLAPLLTVASAGIAFVISQHLLGYIAAATNLQMPNELTAVAVALMLGIVTDYTVFFYTGTRDRLQAGQRRRDALGDTAAENGSIVLTAGLVVSIGVASLMLGTLGFFRSFGPGMAITVFTGLVVSLVLVPALLSLLGRAAFWPGLQRVRRDPNRWRLRLARFATLKSVSLVLVLAAVAVLGLGATGIRSYGIGFGLVYGLPSSNVVARASAAASQGFAKGMIAPTALLLQQPGIGGRKRALSQLQRELAREPRVAGVIGPATVPLRRRFGITVAPNGNAARYAVILADEPTEAPAIADLHRLERDLPGMLRRAGLANARVGWGGETALASETVAATNTSLWRVLLAGLGVNLVFLLVFLRSLVASVVLLLASSLTLACTLGVTLYFFVDGLGYPGIPYYVPVAFSVLLLSLGSDYNIFVVGRIWHAADRMPLREAVSKAVPRAGRSVTIAGIALAFSFATLALIPIGPFTVFAFAMGFGILLDAFLVRSLLVPGLIVLCGRLGRWPRR